MGTIVTYERPDGASASGHYVEPPHGADAPGVVVVQEWWGLGDQIKGVADRFARSGYRVLVPDLYRGTSTLDEAEAEHLMGALDFGDAASQDIRGAVGHLKANGARAAVVGFCMGGALAVLAAAAVPEADAIVSWYGNPPAAALEVKGIQAPLQGHFALNDTFFPAPDVDVLERRLVEAKVAHEFHRYDANHAFGNESGKGYDAQAADQAWSRTLRFVARHIG